MNTLVEALRLDPASVDYLASEERRITLEEIYELPLPPPLVRLLPSRDLLEQADDQAMELLGPAFMAPIAASRWNDAVESARPDATHTAADEWVTFVPGAEGNRGIVLPEDAGRTRAFGLFREIGGRVRRLSVVARRRGFDVTLSVGDHCELPVDRECSGGSCGTCYRVHLVLRGGLRCVCRC